jgi:hypothetical protein
LANFDESMIAQQPVEDRTVRFEVETLDVEHAAIARLHDHRYLTIAGRFTHEELHVERVALFNDEVESVEELAQVLRTNARSVRQPTRR